MRCVSEFLTEDVCERACERAAHYRRLAQERFANSEGEGGKRADSGLPLAQFLLEQVVASDDAFTSAFGLRAVSRQHGGMLALRERLALQMGSYAAIGLPWAVVPIAKRWIQKQIARFALVAHLPTAKTRGEAGVAAGAAERGQSRVDSEYERMVAQLHTASPLGPASFGQTLTRLKFLAQQPEITELLVSPTLLRETASDWAVQEQVQQIAERVVEIIEHAQHYGARVILDAATHEEGVLCGKVLPRVLGLQRERGSRTAFTVTIASEAPEAGEQLEAVIELVRLHGREGQVHVRLTSQSTVRAETVASVFHGRKLAVLAHREQRESQLLALAARAISSPVISQLTLATEDPFMLSAALEFALEQEREITGEIAPAPFPVPAQPGSTRIIAELRRGTCTPLAEVLTEQRIRVNTTLPLVSHEEVASIIPYIIGLAAEFTDTENPLYWQYAQVGDTDWVRERERFERVFAAARASESPAAAHTVAPDLSQAGLIHHNTTAFYREFHERAANPTAGLTQAVLQLSQDEETGKIELEALQQLPQRFPVVSKSGFCNRSQLDPMDAAAQQEFATVFTRARQLRETLAHPARPTRFSPELLEPVLSRLAAEQNPWKGLHVASRIDLFQNLAVQMEHARFDLCAALAAAYSFSAPALESSVRMLIDSAEYFAQLIEHIQIMRGAEFCPDELAVLACTDPAETPTLLHNLLALLAAGSRVLVCAPSECAPLFDLLTKHWQEEAGIPAGAFYAVTDFAAESAATAACDERVDRVITIAADTLCETIIHARPAVRIENRSNDINTILVTPSANVSECVPQIVQSAFKDFDSYSRGPKALILLGGVGKSDRLMSLLTDTVEGIHVGDTVSPIEGLAEEFAGKKSAAVVGNPLAIQVGPLGRRPTRAQLRALTELAPGEKWVVQPRQLDAHGLLWSPGVRAGVKRDATFWQDAQGVPVLGIVHARTLQEAVALQGELGSRSAATLYSWDENEIASWMSSAQAATLTVNRPCTGWMIERLPRGSWSAHAGAALFSRELNSALVSTLQGGPHQLVTLGTWKLKTGTQSSTLHLRGLEPEVQTLIELAQPSLSYEEFDRVRRAALADTVTWRTQLGRARETIGLQVERNMLRYWPVRTLVRIGQNAQLHEAIRVIAAAILVRAPFEISTGLGLPRPLLDFLEKLEIRVTFEDDERCLQQIAASGARVDGLAADRVRLVGMERASAREGFGASFDAELWAEDVTMAGPVELLSFLREQALSVRLYRFGVTVRSEKLENFWRELMRGRE